MIGEIRQIGLVLPNISDYMKMFEKIFNMPVNKIEAQVTKNIYKEDIEPYKIGLGFAMIGNIQIEFIQVLEGKTIYDSFLKEKGGGIHHLGIYVENFEERMKELESKGIKQLMNGIVLGQKFAYYDTEKILGFVVELLDLSKKPKSKNKP